MMTINEMVAMAKKDGASDIHVICGLPPKYRKDGQLENMCEEPLTKADCLELSRWLAGDIYKEMEEIGELDLAGTYAGNRCRVHIFKQQGVPSIALRLLREEIPDLTKLGLPPAAMKLPDMHKGIVLVTGETGSGKSTTLAALLDYVNHHRKAHIVTLEDPVEYLYKPDLCAINQREVGKDTRSFSDGLRASLREDPNVILIGEMRDRDTIETAITAAETGHLVFGTLHTQSAPDSIDRLVDVFPEERQQQIRMQLSMTLNAVVSQQLIKKRGGGRVLAAEVMIVNAAIRNLIREGKTPQIANTLATTADLGAITMDAALTKLVRSRLITKENAIAAAHDPEQLRKVLR